VSFRKSKEQNIEETGSECNPEGTHEHPMVCLIDCSEAVKQELNKLRFNCFFGTFGSEVEVSNKHNEEKLIKPNLDFPKNLHEYDILLLDFTHRSREKYDPKHHYCLDNIMGGTTANALLSHYPEQIFDPVPFSVNSVFSDINDLTNKNSIIIVFCDHESKADYKLVEINHRQTSIIDEFSFSSMYFYQDVPDRQERHGKKMSVPGDGSKLSPLLQKYLGASEYGLVFIHPNILENNKLAKDPSFLPLLTNERKEIVSYAHFVNKSMVLVFPDIKDKVNFVSELFKTYLPEINPEIFPFHGEFGWLESGGYLLPGEQELINQRNEIEENYIDSISRNKDLITKLKNKYKFLADMISESGQKLVSAVEKYFRWLEFESVINLDETNPDILEEDLQVDCGDKFLVVEIKGIGGTSTDKDCSQISKIRYRRSEQRGKFDVFGLYVVNHQRYTPPESRSNPPFSENQIKDAELDKRGLLTTYDLYKAYFLVEEGIMTKKSIRESLFETGLILLKPKNLIFIGRPHEYFMKGEIAIVHLNNISITKGDILIVRKNDSYFKSEIISLMLNDCEVDSASSGEVGIKLSEKIKDNSELFIEKVQSQS
jgi:hypothetical protein